MNTTTTKVLGLAGVGVALYAVGAFSAIGAYFSASPAPAGCTDNGYGYQTGYGYGYIVDCDTNTTTSGSSTASGNTSGGGGGGGSGGSRRDYCPSGDRSGSFRDGRCEALVPAGEVRAIEIADPYTCGGDILGAVEADDYLDVTVTLTVSNSMNTYTFNPVLDSNGEYSQDVSTVVDGMYTVEYTVEDSDGNSDTGTFMADIKAECPETTGGDMTAGSTTGNTPGEEMPTSLAELIRLRNLANSNMPSPTTGNNGGTGTINLPTSLPNTGVAK